METMQQYVVRKLKDPCINIKGVCKTVPINRSKIYRIINGGETSASAIQILHDFFKHLAD